MEDSNVQVVSVESRRSCSDFFNEVFRKLENFDDMFSRNVDMLLKYSSDLKLNYNLSDIPEYPNPLFLEDNQIYLLVPYLCDSDTKNGCQRSFDNFFMLLTPNSFAKHRRSGRHVFVSDIRNTVGSSKDNYKPGLRWVKFGIYKHEDVDRDVDYANLIKRKAGLELLVFLCYYIEHFEYFIKFFGQFAIDGYNYHSNSNQVLDYLAYVYANEESSVPEIGIALSQETTNHCLFLVEDIM